MRPAKSLRERDELQRHECGSVDRIAHSSRVSEIALDAHGAEEELPDLRGPSAGERQRVAQPAARGTTAATARRAHRRLPCTERDRRDRRSCFLTALTARISYREPDTFIEPVRPEMHEPAGFPFYIDLDRIAAGVAIEARRVAFVGCGVIETASGKRKHGRSFPRGCNLKRNQHRQQHGRRYSARWTPLTRAGMGGNSDATTVISVGQLTRLRRSHRCASFDTE